MSSTRRARERSQGLAPAVRPRGTGHGAPDRACLDPSQTTLGLLTRSAYRRHTHHAPDHGVGTALPRCTLQRPAETAGRAAGHRRHLVCPTCHLRCSSRLSRDAVTTLPYLDAVTREVVRLAPANVTQTRTAVRKTVVRLSQPVRGRDGRMMETVTVDKGTSVTIRRSPTRPGKMRLMAQRSTASTPRRRCMVRTPGDSGPSATWSISTRRASSVVSGATTSPLLAVTGAACECSLSRVRAEYQAARGA